MRNIRSFLLLAAALVVFPQAPAANERPLPDASEFIARAKANLASDRRLQSQYTYLERRQEIEVSKLGKVKVGDERLFEVYPGQESGETYKRLIAVNGVPLPPEELARRDEEHRRNMIARIEARQRETPEQREKRLRERARKDAEVREEIEDIFRVYQMQLERRDVYQGHPCIVVRLTPRKNAKTKSDNGKWLKKFKGFAWVTEKDYQVVRVEAEALETISIGLGLIGRIHKGSKAVFERTLVNGEVWLPSYARIEMSGRTLLFRKFDIEAVTSFSDYKKFTVDTNIVSVASPAGGRP